MIIATRVTDILNFNDPISTILTMLCLIFLGIPALSIIYYFFKNLDVTSKEKFTSESKKDSNESDVAERIAECLHYRKGDSLKTLETERNKNAYEVYVFFLTLHDGINKKHKRWIICGNYSKTNVVGGVIEKHFDGYIFKTVYGKAKIKESEYQSFEKNPYFYKGIAYQLGLI